MTDPETLPESDCVANAPHPRFSETMFGQHTAQADFLSAFRQTRLHHAWLLGGARGHRQGDPRVAYRAVHAGAANRQSPQ